MLEWQQREKNTNVFAELSVRFSSFDSEHTKKKQKMKHGMNTNEEYFFVIFTIIHIKTSYSHSNSNGERSSARAPARGREKKWAIEYGIHLGKMHLGVIVLENFDIGGVGRC